MSANKMANPGPLGLLGFGMTTVLLNLHNAGLLPLSIVIVAMGIALGGLAQIIAGIRELCQGNTFAGTAFTAYGLFWWSLVLIWVNPFAEAGIEAGSKIAMGYYLLLWVHVFSIPKEVVTILNDILCFPVNFLLNKYWSFRKK